MVWLDSSSGSFGLAGLLLPIALVFWFALLVVGLMLLIAALVFLVAALVLLVAGSVLLVAARMYYQRTSVRRHFRRRKNG